MGQSTRFLVGFTGMKVLVIHERTGKVREAFHARGHNTFSVDTRKSEIPSPYHMIYEAGKLLHPAFHNDLVISFVMLEGLFDAAPRVALVNSIYDMKLKGLSPLVMNRNQGLAETMAEQWGVRNHVQEDGSRSEAKVGHPFAFGRGSARH